MLPLIIHWNDLYTRPQFLWRVSNLGFNLKSVASSEPLKQIRCVNGNFNLSCSCHKVRPRSDIWRKDLGVNPTLPHDLEPIPRPPPSCSPSSNCIKSILHLERKSPRTQVTLCLFCRRGEEGRGWSLGHMHSPWEGTTKHTSVISSPAPSSSQPVLALKLT